MQNDQNNIDLENILSQLPAGVGIGPHLSEKQKQRILQGEINEEENSEPIDAEKLKQDCITILQDMPITWLLED